MIYSHHVSNKHFFSVKVFINVMKSLKETDIVLLVVKKSFKVYFFFSSVSLFILHLVTLFFSR